MPQRGSAVLLRQRGGGGGVGDVVRGLRPGGARLRQRRVVRQRNMNLINNNAEKHYSDLFELFNRMYSPSNDP